MISTTQSAFVPSVYDVSQCAYASHFADMSSERAIQLLVYDNRLFNAHWSIFVPRRDNPDVGSRLHATGSVVGGFTLEFVRNYNVLSDNRPLQRIDLAVVPEDCIKDTTGDEEIVDTDATPIDRLEQVIITVPAPGPSLRSTTVARDVGFIPGTDTSVDLLLIPGQTCEGRDA